jgi:hypothetical protein
VLARPAQVAIDQKIIMEYLFKHVIQSAAGSTGTTPFEEQIFLKKQGQYFQKSYFISSLQL